METLNEMSKETIIILIVAGLTLLLWTLAIILSIRKVLRKRNGNTSKPLLGNNKQ